MVGIIILKQLPVFGQSPIVAFSTSYVSASSTVTSYSELPATVGSFSSCSSSNYTYTFSNGTANLLKVPGFTANAKNYLISSSVSTVKLRRVDNANATGNRSIVYGEATTSPV